MSLHNLTQFTNKSTQTDFDSYFMRLAESQRQHSHDPMASTTPKSSVGAVIASGSELISRASNQLPGPIKNAVKEQSDSFLMEQRSYLVEHAERLAIFAALREGRDLSDASLYCTRFPCADCSRAIILSGLKRLVVGAGFGDEKKWLESQRASNFILRAGGVTVRYLRTSTR